ncbi:MAG: CBS domain-containing protein [Thermoplasmata archaeon]|nr:CBS domain-containing protein [Thermoplasmata archaeon]
MEDDPAIKHIMNSNIVTVSPGLSLTKAANLMEQNHIGSLIVMSRKKPLGIVTERDFLYRAMANNMDPKKTKIRDIMTTPIHVINKELKLTEAAKQMTKLKVRRLPVVNGDNNLVGILSQKDILKIAPHLLIVAQEHINTYLEAIISNSNSHPLK